MCRGEVTKRSMNTAPSPKAFTAGYRPFEAVFQFGIFTNDAHAFTTATSTGLDEQGVADAVGHLACLFRCVNAGGPVPGTNGTSNGLTVSFAASLDPMVSIAGGEGR